MNQDTFFRVRNYAEYILFQMYPTVKKDKHIWAFLKGTQPWVSDLYLSAYRNIPDDNGMMFQDIIHAITYSGATKPEDIVKESINTDIFDYHDYEDMFNIIMFNLKCRVQYWESIGAKKVIY